MHKVPPGLPLALKVFFIAAALLLYLLPLPQGWIDHHYSEGFYLVLQRAITPLSSKVPLAIFDLLVVGALVGLIACWWTGLKRSGKGRRFRALPRLLLNTAVLAAAAVFIFLVMFGLNYRRTPLAAKLDYDPARITPQSARELAALDVENLNQLVNQVHAVPWPSKHDWAQRLAPSFQSVIKDLGNSKGIATCQPKVSIFDPYLNAAGFAGFTDPFCLEVILDSHLLPQELPFSLAHEWGHLAGFADESEANFIALLTCLRSEDPAVRYVGWLSLYQYFPSRVFRKRDANDADSSGASAPQADLKLDPQVIADLVAIENRLANSVKPWLSAPVATIYDRYLKANRVQAGITSYGLVVRLVLGTRFEANWSPALKSQ